MIRLLNYEINKIFRQIKWTGLTMVLLALFFLISGYFSGSQLDATASTALQILTSVSFMGLGILMGILFIAPMVAAIVNYHKDLNDPRAVFESALPHSGWKRLGAKLLVYFGWILTGILLSGLIGWLTFMVIRLAAPEQVTFEIDQRILELIRLDGDPLAVVGRILSYVLTAAWGLTQPLLFFTFFITLHSVLRHRIRGAVPLTFLLGAATSMLLSLVEERLFAPGAVFSGNLLGLPADNWLSLILAAGAFLAMGWMLEHKTELK